MYQYKKDKKIRYILILSIFFLNIIECSSQTTLIKEEDTYISKSTDLNNTFKTYDTISKEIDRVFNNDTTKIELYLQLNEKATIKRVPNYNNTPESYFASFNIIRNKSGQIIYIAEYPADDSGDWNLIYESYFDKKGNLITFVRKCSFFNGECADIVHEKSEYFYNLNHALMKKTYEITDENKKPLNFKKCVFNYRYDYKIYTTLTEYLKNYIFEK